MTDILLVVFAFFAGVVGGMGMGGGTILIPLLTLFLGFEQKQAQGLNLVGFWFLAPVALFMHFKNKLVVLKPVIFLILFAAPFAVLGSFFANAANKNLLKICFGVFLIIVSITEFYQAFVSKSN